MHCTNCGKENDAGNEYCMFCGTKLYKPEPATGSEDAEVRAAPPPSPEEPDLSTPTPAPKRRRSRKVDRRIWWIAGAAVASVLAITICVGVVGGFWGLRLFSPARQLIYTIQEKNLDKVTAFMAIRENGKNNREIYSDNDGFQGINVQNYFGWPRYDTISQDGSAIAVLDSNGDLMLLDTVSSASVPVETQSESSLTSSGISWSFSPDGKYFAFTDTDKDTLILVVTDRKGNPIYTGENMVFAGFLPDNRIVAFQTDKQNLTDLGVLDVKSGEFNSLTGIETTNPAETDWHYAFLTVVSPDGNTIYYQDGKNLMNLPSKGGSSSVLYESDSGFPVAFFSPDKRTMAILDMDGNSLYLYDTRRDEKSHIANDVQNAAFSPDGKYLGYVTNDGNSQADLHLSRLDGTDKIRIAKNASWIKFAFSPDGRYIAYIDGSSIDSGGALYVARRDGSHATRLDTGVWSFRYTEDGNSIVYVKVADLDSGNPESEILRINTNGRNKKTLLQADDGLYTIIWPVP
jgi:dipeptidyl aminopeptidase/acylaminoacyl peptidase